MFIPIGDDNSRRISFPYVTLAIVAANVVAFLAELQLGDAFVVRYSVIPASFAGGQLPIFTIFSAMFLHGGWAHLLGNMLYLYVFGDNVEDTIGHARFLVFYLFCGAVAFGVQIAAHQDSLVPNLGASGAISGVLAAYMILFPKNKVRVLLGFFVMNVSAWFVLGLWAATQFLAGYGDVFHTTEHSVSGVAYLAHVGGFVTGAVLVILFKPAHENSPMLD